MYGVSPAYFISRFGTGFRSDQIASALSDLVRIGFDSFQLEVFDPRTLSEWGESGASTIREAAERAQITPGQFVAHFLLHSFEDAEVIQSDRGIEEFARVVRSLEQFSTCRTVTVPLPALQWNQSTPVDNGVHGRLFDRTAHKIGKMAEIADSANIGLALEILPHSVVDGSDGFLRLCDKISPLPIGYNFDSGHAWAMKERLELIPSKLQGRILGTHLCDNDGGVNNSWTPGQGTIEWESFLSELAASKYRGAMDIEIHCKPDQVDQRYREGLEFVRKIWDGLTT